MKRTVLSVLALSALVYSCKKDDDKSNAEKIVGKWDQTTQIEIEHISGVDHNDTMNFPAGFSTVEFTSDGKYYSQDPVYKDTATYRIDGSNLILLYKGNTEYDTFALKNLTGSDLTTSSRDMSANGDYDETISTYKKK